jgi:excisionase family DNA binding protein
MPEKTFTTHDIAKFCDVYPSTAANWIREGKLKSYQTPGGHNRVSREELVGFLSQLNIPIPAVLTERIRVLVVDDDEETAKLFVRAFSRHKEYEAESCGDGIEALIRIGRRPPDLVILDIALPKMDGVQVCRVLKSKPETRGIKVIAVSGKRLPEKKLHEVGVDAIFRKPVDLVELLAMSAEVLGLKLAPAARKLSQGSR